MNTHAKAPNVQVGTAEELLATIPYLLQFHPAESLVFVAFTGHTVAVTGRVDLTQMRTVDDIDKVLATLQRNTRVTGLIFVGYSTDWEAAWATLTDAETAAARAGLGCMTLAVNGQLWQDHPYGPEQTMLPSGITAGQLAFAAQGIAPMASREALQRVVAATETDTAALTEALALGRFIADRMPDAMKADFVRGFAADTTATQHLALSDAAAVALVTADARRALIRDMNRHNADRWMTFWLTVANRNLPEQRTLPLGLAGLAGWLFGDGAMVNVVLDEIAQIAPDDALARLLHQLVVDAVPPDFWEDIKAATRSL